MAVELKLEYSITPEISTITVKEVTGAYTIDNPAGWGGPNIERNSVALVLYALYQPYNKDEINLSASEALSQVLKFDPTYPNTEKSEFQIPYLKDGWYKFYLVAVPTENSDPQEGDIIFNALDGNLEVYKDSEFVLLEESTDWQVLIDTEKYISVFEQEILMLKLILKRNCALENYFECMKCTSCKCDIKKEELLKLETMIQATDYRFHSQKEFEAQRMVEVLTREFKCCK